MRNKIKHITGCVALLLLTGLQPLWAGNGSGDSVFSNPLAVVLLILMLILLIIIGVLGYILIGAADINRKKSAGEGNKKMGALIRLALIPFFILTGADLFAQDATTNLATGNKTVELIGGMSTATFYIMVSAIFLELAVILVLLLNIRFLLKQEKQKLIVAEMSEEAIQEAKRSKLNWWDKINKLRPVSEEAELDLGHEYDGIRELNNRLPPWWLYGFYATIIFACIYLWRFHVSHTGLSSKEEYAQSIMKADLEIKEYLKAKGEAVDENTVTFLSAKDELEAGKSIFINSCAACHKPTGGGDVGPNLTDDYWIHGNDLKSVFKTIRYGINAMPQWQNTYSNKQIAQVASYVKSLHGTNPPNAKAPQGTEMKEEAKINEAADTLKISAANKVVVKE